MISGVLSLLSLCPCLSSATGEARETVAGRLIETVAAQCLPLCTLEQRKPSTQVSRPVPWILFEVAPQFHTDFFLFQFIVIYTYIFNFTIQDTNNYRYFIECDVFDGSIIK